MPDDQTYITRQEFENNASEVRLNLRSFRDEIRDEIRELKNLRNCSTVVASGVGSGIMYVLLNFLQHGGHW